MGEARRRRGIREDLSPASPRTPQARRRDGHIYSARQRVIVLTFDSIEEAEAWDADGQPLDLITYDGIEVA